jgi:hypothetical protein
VGEDLGIEWVCFHRAAQFFEQGEVVALLGGGSFDVVVSPSDAFRLVEQAGRVLEPSRRPRQIGPARRRRQAGQGSAVLSQRPFRQRKGDDANRTGCSRPARRPPNP